MTFTRTAIFAAMLSLAFSTSMALAVSQGPVHVTDGQFTTPAEWTQPTSSVTHFPVVGSSGGADLHADSDNTNLYLMYDAQNTTALGLNQANSFFNVFFQVTSEQEDYLVHIVSQTGAFTAYEKDTGVVSPLNPDDSFDTTSPVWSALTPDDLLQAQFHSAVSTDSTDGHLRAEFQLTVKSGQNPGGLYSPDPAFWSASVGDVNGLADPPISSGIFQLHPDGTVLVAPALGANGAPALQPQDVQTPEPSTFVMAVAGLAGLLFWGRRRMPRVK
jgi:hypothetical protein